MHNWTFECILSIERCLNQLFKIIESNEEHKNESIFEQYKPEPNLI